MSTIPARQPEPTPRGLKSAFLLLLRYLICVTLLFLLGAWFWNYTHRTDENAVVILTKARQGDFIDEVIGRGTVESASNVSINCPATRKTTISSLIPEGTWVEQGEVIAQLDTNTIEQRMLLFSNWAENARSDYQTYLLAIHENESQLEEYIAGTIKANRMKIDNTIARTRNNIMESEQLVKSSERLVLSGYATDTQLEVDRIALQKNVNSLKKSLLDRFVLQRYASEKIIVERISQLEASRTSFDAVGQGYNDMEKMYAELTAEYEAHTMRSPDRGQIVYANQTLRPGMSQSEIIEEGATVRPGQLMFRIPNPDHMQIRGLVNEEHVLHIKEGMRVVLMFDVLRKRTFEGIVVKVNPYPEAIHWDMRKRFAITIDIVDPKLIRASGIDLRTGLSVDLRIILDMKKDVLLVPLNTLVASGDKNYCLVRYFGAWKEKEVLVATSNDREAVVVKGLRRGESVVVGAKRYAAKVELPAESAPSIYGSDAKKYSQRKETKSKATGDKKAGDKKAGDKKPGTDNKDKNKKGAPSDKPDMPGGPDMPPKSDMPSAPDMPPRPDMPGGPDKPARSDKSVNPDVPGEPGLSNTPNEPKGPNEPNEPKGPPKPDKSAKSVKPDAKTKVGTPSPVDDAEALRKRQERIARVKKYFEFSTVELCAALDSNQDDLVSRSEVKKEAPALLDFFDEWDTNRDGLLTYCEIAIGFYRLRFTTEKKQSGQGESPVPDGKM